MESQFSGGSKRSGISAWVQSSKSILYPTFQAWKAGVQILGSNSSRGESIWHLRNGVAGLEVAVLQAQGVQFLHTGIDLLVHGGILRGNPGEFINQTSPALVIVPLGVLETLAILSRALGSLAGTSLGVHRSCTLHSRGRGGTRNPSPLAVG